MIAIKDMKMPKSCLYCQFCQVCINDKNEPYRWCYAMLQETETRKKRHKNCPLVEVK